jgi:hypothetical protein
MAIAYFTSLEDAEAVEVEFVVGLNFLRRFARWGAERAADRQWRFFLEYIVGNHE